MKDIKINRRDKRDFIPLSVPYLTGKEWKNVKECFDTNWVSSAGPFVDKFEKMVVDYTGAKYAVACVNGTSALHISLILLNIGVGDEVITSDLTFVAPANAIRYTGAYPVFVDAEYDSFQMDLNKLEDFLKKNCEKSRKGLYNKKTGRFIKAIMPVHILGNVCKMDDLLLITQEYNLPIIEDATEALGAKWSGKQAGTFGKVGVLSFNGNKIITTGGGGMIITDDQKLAQRAKYLTTQAKDDAVEFIHNNIGFNYRLCNVLSAIGCGQMENIDKFVAKKRKIAQMYEKKLSGVEGIKTMKEPKDCSSTFWLYTIKIEKNKFGIDRKKAMNNLYEIGIETRPLWQPMHLLKPHKNSFSTDCKTAERLKKESLSLPSSVGLTREEQKYVVDQIMKLKKGEL